MKTNTVDLWKKYILEDVIDKFIDYRGKTPKKSSSGIPLITAKIVKEGRIQEPNEFISEDDYESWMTRGLPELNDVVLTTEAPLGEVALIEDSSVALAQRIITLRGKKDIVDNRFLKYYFQSKEGQYELQSRASGTTVFGIKAAVLRKVPILLPPLPEQKAIASVLSSLDDKIDLLHRQNKTLEAMAETLFRQWFIEEADDGWVEGCLGEVMTVKGGTTPDTKNNDYWHGEICWATPRDLSNSQFIYLFDTDRKISEQGLATISSGMLPVGTILLSSRAPIGYLAITDTPLAVNQGFIAIVDDKCYSKYFIYLWIKNNLDYIVSNANGSTFLEINKSVFRSLEILKPPVDLRNIFDRSTTSIFEKIRENSKQILALERLRGDLLSRLMSGRMQIISGENENVY